MRIGVFGGTFDPVHLGHLVVAEQSREQAMLDQVWFVPSYSPPHKAHQAITPFDRRVEMLQLALAGQSDRFRVETLERDRSGPSYTADTLDRLHERHPEHEWYLIVGADCLPDLPGWHEPTRILTRATLLACGRPGYTMLDADELVRLLGVQRADLRLTPIEVPQISLSSQDLRQRKRAGRSLLYLVPRAVEVYISEKNLYCD